MGGHATHDEAEARATFPQSLFDHWGRRDPIGLYEAWLLGEGIADPLARPADRQPDRGLDPRLPRPASGVRGAEGRRRMAESAVSRP